MNLFKSFGIGIGKKSRKAAHPSGGVGSSNPPLQGLAAQPPW